MALEKTKNYFKSRLTRILLLLVILTFGFSMRTAVQAKYNLFLNDMTSAVAGDFIFKSNYLFEEQGRHEITSFNGTDYEIAIDFMNYENSLRYNTSGTDFLFSVEAQVFEDKNCTTPHEQFMDAQCVQVLFGEDDDNLAATRDDGYGKTIKYGLMRGLDITQSNTFEMARENGSGFETVKIAIKPSIPIYDSEFYLKVTAKVLPLAEMSNYLSDHTLEMKNGYSAPDTKRGIYYEELSAVFDIKGASSESIFTDEFFPGESSNYEVTYRLRCKESSAGTAFAKVFFDDTKVSSDPSFGTPVWDAEKNKYYIPVQCQAGGSVTMKFYRKSLDGTIEKSDFGFEQTDSLAVDEKEYDLADKGSQKTIKFMDSEGTVISKAKMTTQITVKVTPPTGMMVSGFTAIGKRDGSPDQNIIINDMFGQENTYWFTMPNATVEITPSFCHKVQVDWTPKTYGSVRVVPEGALPGTPVTVYVTVNDGYVQEYVKINGTAVEELSSTGDYSFIMPSGEAKVEVGFMIEPEPVTPTDVTGTDIPE